MTPYDENIILKQLNSIMSAQPLSSEEEPLPPWKAQQLIQARNRLRRKLIVRKVTAACTGPVEGCVYVCVCVCVGVCVCVCVCVCACICMHTDVGGRRESEGAYFFVALFCVLSLF